MCRGRSIVDGSSAAAGTHRLDPREPCVDACTVERELAAAGTMLPGTSIQERSTTSGYGDPAVWGRASAQPTSNATASWRKRFAWLIREAGPPGRVVRAHARHRRPRTWLERGPGPRTRRVRRAVD